MRTSAALRSLMMARARHILVVDDNADLRAILRELLEEEGCCVYEAADGSMALEILRSLVPDLIVLDLLMPVMDGWTFHAELQKDPVLAKVPVAFLSGAEDIRISSPAHVLKKPITLSSLLGLLQAVDEPERIRAPALATGRPSGQ
jgi:CheY-like chemotaxis protein